MGRKKGVSLTLRPSLAATPATWRVWFDCTPPMLISVSQPWARASGMRYLKSVSKASRWRGIGWEMAYSSFRVLFPPNAMPELQSSLLAHIDTLPPRASEIRGRWWIGENPKRRSVFGMLANGSGSVRTGILGNYSQCILYIKTEFS